MYNPATQVQVPIDVNLGSYFQKTKIVVGASPTAFPFKKKSHVPLEDYLHIMVEDEVMTMDIAMEPMAIMKQNAPLRTE
jgi:hypothetical protein